ncbi:hypothetical protein J6590_038662 [Homalodisca vitripennis]|nr:hypothetical protein J6590_038662 [Homalodisca vitripennis]
MSQITFPLQMLCYELAVETQLKEYGLMNRPVEKPCVTLECERGLSMSTLRPRGEMLTICDGMESGADLIPRPAPDCTSTSANQLFNS